MQYQFEPYLWDILAEKGCPNSSIIHLKSIIKQTKSCLIYSMAGSDLNMGQNDSYIYTQTRRCYCVIETHYQNSCPGVGHGHKA